MSAQHIAELGGDPLVDVDRLEATLRRERQPHFRRPPCAHRDDAPIRITDEHVPDGSLRRAIDDDLMVMRPGP